MTKIKEEKIHRTNVVTSADLDRYGGAVKLMRQAWDNLPEDVDSVEREMFVEITSRVLTLHTSLSDREKDTNEVN